MLDAQTIEGFANACLVKKYDTATKIPKCHLEWWDICCSTSRYTAIAAPRGHAKSTSITFAFVLASVLFRQSSYVILVSDTEGQAVQFLGDIKQELLENEDITKFFGIAKFRKLAETDIIVEFDDGICFRISAKGAEQKLRGLKWDKKRPDLIVCDDLENEEIVQNQDRREKFRRWFYGALLPSLSVNGKCIVVGTILHMDSLLERLMPSLNAQNTVDDGLKVYSKKPLGGWISIKYRAHDKEFNKILWRDRFDEKYFREKRQEYIAQGMPDVYNQEFLNYPIDESRAYFRREDLINLRPEDLNPDLPLAYYAAVDFAVSTKERSDYTAIAVCGVTPTGIILVKDVRRDRWDAKEIIDELFAVHQRYKPELFVVEQGTIEKAIGPFLRNEMVRRNSYINLYPMFPSTDKLSRARSIQARLRSGGIRFDKEATWYPDLEDELVRFPKDKHDDQVDALAWIGLVLDQIREAPTKEEIDEEEYQEEFGTQYAGRNSTTGY
jgi:phage uncharacterized protein (putative large terminase), C-terminal domain